MVVFVAFDNQFFCQLVKVFFTHNMVFLISNLIGVDHHKHVGGIPLEAIFNGFGSVLLESDGCFKC